MADGVERIVALGASNLTRGLSKLVSSACAAWGPQIEVVAALGHGRSYGGDSRVTVRTLPGILQCGVWRHLDDRPAARTRALVTDIGNDILYGYAAEQILVWVEEAVDRLSRVTSEITVTQLPLATIRRLTPAKFVFFRSMFFPSCRLSFESVTATAARINEGLEALAERRRARLCRPEASWYGFDPIHIRPASSRAAWCDILGTPQSGSPRRMPRRDAVRLQLMRPEREWLFGVERLTPQSGLALQSGGRVWLY